MPKCTYCQTNVEIAKPGRGDDCLCCGRSLRSCYQCRFYDRSVHHECREPEASFVAEKEKANFCDYFVFAPQIHVKTEDQEKLKARLNTLFKKK